MTSVALASDIASLSSAADAGLLRLLTGATYLMPRKVPCLPPLTTLWALQGEFSFLASANNVWHGADRVIINKHNSTPHVALADNIHSFQPGVVNLQLQDYPPSQTAQVVESQSGNPLALIATQWSTVNIYHKLYDAICKLRLVELAEPGCSPEALIPSGFGFEALLDCLAIPYCQYDSRALYSGTFYLPSMPSRIGIPTADSLDFLRRKASHIPVSDGRFLYVSRPSSGKRFIVNESEVIDYLSRYLPLTVVDFAQLSFAEQISAGKSARVVLGPHGAGLSWGGFSEHCSLFEMFPSDYVNGCYEWIYRQNGHCGRHITSADVPESLARGLQADAGFFVDINSLRPDFEAFLDTINKSLIA